MSASFPANQVARAFTMVELLVVISIVAILAGLIVPVLSGARESADTAQSMNNLRQLVASNQSYAADHGCYSPADDRSNNKRWHGARTTASAPFDPTKGYLSDYLGESRQVTICPRFKKMRKGSASFEEGTGGYGYNSAYIGGQPKLEYQKDANDRSRISARVTQVARANTVMFTTSAYANGDAVQEYPFCEPPFWDFGNGPVNFRPSPSVHFRFREKALVGWCDGRVTLETCDPREVGFNPHGGDANQQQLGWLGPDEQNGFWNPNRD